MAARQAAGRWRGGKGWAVPILLGLWLALAGDQPLSWFVGLPAVAAGLWIMFVLPPAPPWTIRLGKLPGFLLFFAWHSFLAGMDVAFRAFRPRRELHPALIQYPLRLSEGAGRVFLMNSISLMPGTFSADVKGSVLWVHVLDERRPVAGQLARLEEQVGRLFGLDSLEERSVNA